MKPPRDSVFFLMLPAFAAVLAMFILPFLPGCSKTPEDHARIAKTGSGDYSEQKRLASVRALAEANEQTLLADVAANAAYADTQGAALDKLTDERLLADVIKGIEHRRDSIVTAARMEKIADPQLLASLAREARSGNVRVTAAITLGDQALLADIARNGADASIRKRAVENLADQPVLAGIALNDRDESVRLEAARRVSDQALLASLAQDEKADESVRIEAVSRLDDQRVLAAIAKAGGKDAEERSVLEPLRLKALERLTDQRALADIAKNVAGEITFESRKDDMRILQAALERISDQATLADIAMSAHPSFAFSAVLEKITDQEALVRLLKNNQANDEIVKKLTDQKLLAGIAGGDDFEDVRMEAANRLTDPQALSGLARRGKDEGIALAAVKKIADPQMLAEIAGDGNASTNARLWALWRVADRALLAKIAKDATDERVRNAASEKLAGATPGTTPQTITDLIKNGKLLAGIGGSDIQRIYVHLQKIVPSSLEILIPAGTYFVCDNPKAQNMVSTEDVRITLAESQTETGANTIPVACANRPKDVPGGSDHFTIGVLPETVGEELGKLMAIMRGKNTAFAVKQAAVWMLTDNADYEDLGKLITRTIRIGDSRFSPISERRMIQEPEAAAAMRLCADAGIDIKTKNIWRAARELHAHLPAGGLRDWLQAFGGFTPPTHVGGIANLLVTPDGKRLLTADDQGDATLWSLPDGKLIKTLERGLGYRHAVISLDGGRLITEEGVEFSFSDGKLVQKPGDEKRFGWSGNPVFSPDGSLLAGVAHNHGKGGNLIKVVSFPERVLLATLDPGRGHPRAIAISPDGKQLAALGAAGLKFWSLPDGKLITTLEKESESLISRDWKWRVSFRREKKYPASGGIQRAHIAIDIHNPADGARVKTLAEYPGTLNRRTTLTTDGKHLLLMTDGAARLLSLPDGALLMTVENIEDCILSPDGKLLLTREKDTLTARRLPDGEILDAFKLPGTFNHAVISPDNTLLVMNDSDTTAPAIVKLLSLPDGQLIKTLEGK
ncbi:MAG: hypothetical protein LBG65_00665 [Puniceicoccales bacterium]|jgi:WD40 repeat protein|nr:hypothetical protein [Puniceicoccales bacterium]